MGKWRSRFLATLLVCCVAFAIWLTVLIAGYHPYECAADSKAQGDACDFLSFAGLPARIVVRFTERYDRFFGVVGALAVAAFTFTLWRATSGLKDSTDSLWSAGERQYRLSEDTARRQLRAYMSVRRVSVTNFSAGHKFRIEAIFVNSGQTPARQVSLVLRATGGDSVDSRFERGMFKLSSPTPRLELGASESYTAALDGSVELTEESVREIKDKEAFLIVGVIMRYADVFGRKHRLILRGHLALHSAGTFYINAASKNNRGD